jgi:DNA-binding transcriptional LysR family regulator
MPLRNVELFCEVVRCRSFTRAAEQQQVSQSSVSQAITSLEKRLGTRLIDRSHRPLELTPAGQVYYEGCRELLDGFREIEDRVQRMGDKITGRVRVVSIFSVGLSQMEAYVSRFEDLYPDVSLQVEYLHPDELYDRVLNDKADLGLVSFPKAGGDLTAIDWQLEEMVLVVPPGHRLAGRGSCPVSELDGEEFVSFTAELKIRRQLDRWLKEARVAVSVVQQFDNIENIKRAVEVGTGVAALPLPTVRKETEAGALVPVRVEGVEWTRPLGIVHKRHKSLSTAAGKFIDLLKSEPVNSELAEPRLETATVASGPVLSGQTGLSGPVLSGQTAGANGAAVPNGTAPNGANGAAVPLTQRSARRRTVAH